jgi:hypothetical protein
VRIASPSLASTLASWTRVSLSLTGLASLAIPVLSRTERARPRSVSAACSRDSRPPRSATVVSVTGVAPGGLTSVRGLSLALSVASRSVSSTRSISLRSALAWASHCAASSCRPSSVRPAPSGPASSGSVPARSDAIRSSSPATFPARSPAADLAGCTRGLPAKTSPPVSPAAAPMSVSATRPVAAACVPTDEKISIALIGTSSRSSPSRSTRPMTRAAAMTSASCHQEKPMNSATPIATSTPTVTLSTLRMALRMVW